MSSIPSRGKLKLKGEKKPKRYIFWWEVWRRIKYSCVCSSVSSKDSKIPPDTIRREKEALNEDQSLSTMTEAQKRHRQKLLERERDMLARGKKGKELEIKSFREKVEEFNSKLSKLTEHNDIPRISAAGNG